jgi:hypothetical protein
MAERAFALEGDLSDLRMIEAVDDVEHRRLAGAVGPDDRADLTLVNVEADILDRLHAAERQRNITHVQHHVRLRSRQPACLCRCTATFIPLPP